MAIDREKILGAAQKYVEKKKYDRAVIEYQRIIHEDPNDARTLLKIGDLQSKMEAYADAVGTYERVGKFYANQGFSLKAIAVYKQIREIIARYVPKLEDQYAHITPKLAELYQQLGLTSDALAALDEVATRLQRQSRDQEAVEVFRKIVELDPTNPLPHLRLAEALSHGKDTDGAVTEFGVAAGQLLKLGRRDDALKVIERLLHHKPEMSHARIAAELYLARSGPNDGLQALAKLQICFQANPRDLDTLALLARAFNHLGQAAKAVEVQKEMARIARDSGKSALFHEIVSKLQKLAPNDEGVRQLVAGSDAPPPLSGHSAPGQRAEGENRAADEDGYEDLGDSGDDLGDGDVEREEQPLELARRSAPTELDEDLVVESSIEIVEDLDDTQATAGQAEIAHLLIEAAAFRREGVYRKTIETLGVALEISPKAIEVHEMLRDVLLDAGQTREAVAQMLRLAGLLVESLDGDGAARALQDALALDPGNERANRMLHELGYELVEDSGDEEPPQRIARASSDPDVPLPSYDLEEIGPEDVALRSYSEPNISAAQEADPFDVRTSQDTDPFGANAAQGGGDLGSRARQGAQAQILANRQEIEDIDDPFVDPPLPSFPLHGTEDEGELGTVAQERVAYNGATHDQGLRPPGPPGGMPELESALEEAEFFASRGLFDDARTILDEQLVRLPNHPLLLERVAELDAQEHGMQGGSGTRVSPSAADGDDRAFDIAESLGALDEGDRASGIGPGSSFGAPVEQVDVDEVFAKFKEGVAKQISVDDAQSHYDLGVAYKEMGLLDDALREFDVAARDPKRACVCQSMIGTIQIERGNLNEAIDAFVRGLQAPDHTKDQEASLSYEIGAAYEVKRLSKQALDYFQRAARLNPGFRDVQDRIRRLQKIEPKQQPRAVAVGADDEFDRAFEDIMGERKSP